MEHRRLRQKKVKKKDRESGIGSTGIVELTCVRMSAIKRKDGDDVYDAPRQTDKHSTRRRSDVPPPCLGGGSITRVGPGQHPRFTRADYGQLNHDHAHAQVTHKRLTRDVSNKGAGHPAMVAEPGCVLRQRTTEPKRTTTRTTTTVLIVGEHSTGDAIKTSDIGSRTSLTS